METAVLEQATAAMDEAPPAAELPVTAESDALETDAEGTPVTEGEESEGEAPQAFTAAELEAAKEEATKKERGNWEHWKTETEAKAKAEADESAYRNGLNLASQQADQQRHAAAYNALQGHLKAAVDAGKDVDPQFVGNLAGHMNQAARNVARYQAHDQYGRDRVAAFAELAPTYRPSPELIEDARRAQAAFDYKGLARIDMRMALEAARQQVTAEATAKAEADVAARAAQKPTTKPAATAGPTGAGSTVTSKARSPREILDNEPAGSPAWRKAYRAEHGIDP